MIPIPSKAFTHGGKFHADDVFSTALLKFLNPELRVERGFKVPSPFDGIVYDIGFGVFDHHQKDAEIRANGTPYASFGLVWREFGARILGKYVQPDAIEAEVTRFDDKFIRHIDKDDNTGCGDIIADLIGGFNPNWDSTENQMTCFNKAVGFATTILKNRFDSIASMHAAKEVVSQAIQDMQDGIIELPMYLPWKMTVAACEEAKFVVYPSQREGYSAQCVSNNDDTKTLKVPFPVKWAGQPEAELVVLSGIKTMKFCHNNCFLISATEKQDAIDACKKAMEENIC